MTNITFQQRTLMFINRWFLNSFAIYILVSLFGSASNYSAGTFFLAGFIFSIVNAVLRPIITILSLPAILVTLGLFSLVVNGFIIWFSILLVPNIHMTFWNAVVSGAVMSLLNYVLGGYIENSLER